MDAIQAAVLALQEYDRGDIKKGLLGHRYMEICGHAKNIRNNNMDDDLPVIYLLTTISNLKIQADESREIIEDWEWNALNQIKSFMNEQ